jgi:hypothetical protein
MKFFSRSLLILLALYGLVFAVGDAYLAHADAHLGIALAFAVATIAIQFLLAPVFTNLMLGIHRDEKGTELPAATREFLDRLCAQRGIDVPRIGIIFSGTPNAFCFGYTPGHANLVVTSRVECSTPWPRPPWRSAGPGCRSVNLADRAHERRFGRRKRRPIDWLAREASTGRRKCATGRGECRSGRAHAGV